MEIVQYGDWKIAVDIEKTKAYYDAYVKHDNQANRNFAEYCKTLTDEERRFFDAFGITPDCCDIESLGVHKKKEIPCGGYYLVCGTYLEAPPEAVVTMEEFLAQEVPVDYNDPRVEIGAFQFDFQCADHIFKMIPEDMPEGFLCIRFWCEALPWLLAEKPEIVMYEPPRSWQILRRIREWLQRRKVGKAYVEEQRKAFQQAFDKLGISYVEMTAKAYAEHCENWVRVFSPADGDQREIKRLCLSGKGDSPFLWHLFSYEYVKAAEENVAESLYDAVKKTDCVLISNVEKLGFRLQNADRLTAEAVAQFLDVTVTALDFSFTYAKTHEEGIGPYYYKK